MSLPSPSLGARCGAEALGTFILVFFGCGSVHVAVLTGALVGLWQVAVVWALAITLAIFLFGSISGAHINPAITLAFASWRRFAWRDVGPYIAAQLAGAVLAAGMLFLLFDGMLLDKERGKNVERGKPGSEITAMCYGEYFPNPGKFGEGEGPYDRSLHEAFNSLVSERSAFVAEFLGTLCLALVVFALTDPRNGAAPGAGLVPAFIGLTVAMLICVFAPLTQAGFNPARDFGPRLFAWWAGWGEIALPGPRGNAFFTVYILSPILGAITGGGLYSLLIRNWLPLPSERTT